MRIGHLGSDFVIALIWVSALGAATASAQDSESVQRGKYLYLAADCRGCHGNSHNESPSGGKALETPFGTFYAPNISADPVSGIGKWTDEDFRRAVRNGVAPGGKHLFPVFPYPSYTGLTDADIHDLKNYLWSLPSSSDPSREHKIKFPFGFRPMMFFWKLAFFNTGPLVVQTEKSLEWNRGRYLVQAVVHCPECHSPRNTWTGVVDHRLELAGNIGGPDGMNAPNITPDKDTGIGLWTAEEIERLLKTGETPDYDLVSSGMTSVVRGTKVLTDFDRKAIAIYLRDLPPIRRTTKAAPPAK